ncbi:Thiaminase-2 [Vibrio mediterranei]|uniref:Aminopyrimidine aminohydrolase n=1 Tax=Vibrio mediterranei TaxID=689 RepID=A0ABX5DHB7_9VIBR|nr:thiaminase II [Vibrio mediterranei]MCG9658175.1 thiaminase II [Vibrio mediterranei]MCG9665844.1 thiaminase II [Vibrio mediterranei]PCD87391.1 thiaminase II [Vibrio mediterranei]PRQ68453.1 thiaminase II [Vibrio mediterranei]SBO12359.1 Thiaminase-2 [Vibrio mediterranei]
MNHQDLINACQQEWLAYTEHDFVKQLAVGTLAQQAYLHYLKQDFLFLKQYARAYALAIYKAKTLAQMREAVPSVEALLNSEIGHHVAYCQQWGVTEADMEAEVEDFGTVAYTRYVLDAGMTGELVDLYAALAPCAIGYAVIGDNLLKSADTMLENNPYRSWIELYGSEEFQSGVQTSIKRLDVLLKDIDLQSQRAQEIIHVFKTATRMEIAFWQQGLDAA